MVHGLLIVRTSLVEENRFPQLWLVGPRVWASVVAEAGSVVVAHGHIGFFGSSHLEGSYAGNLL